MGDTPICLLVDGEADTRALEETYAASILRRAEIEQGPLAEAGLGSLRTKNVALWLSPFETYLLLDADAVVWGDMRMLADFERYDFLLDTPIGDAREIRAGVMDVDVISESFSPFDAYRYRSRYVNNGAYFGRRGLIDLDEYLDLLEFGRRHPGLLYGSQGPLNLMLFRLLDEGRIRIGHRELQVKAGDVSPAELRRRFPIVDGRPRVGNDPVALHWVGVAKPRVHERASDYFAPMTFFRRTFLEDARGGGASPLDLARLRLGDAMCRDRRGRNLRGRWSQAVRRGADRRRALKASIHRRLPRGLLDAATRRGR